jgi:hypothetical protein
MVTALTVWAGRLPQVKKNIISCIPDSRKRTVKMLTQDGKLVEIDEALLPAERKKISNSELKNWIKS